MSALFPVFQLSWVLWIVSFNSSVLLSLLPLFSGLPAFPALSAEPASPPQDKPVSPHEQEYLLDLKVKLASLRVDVLTDANECISTLSLEKLNASFAQGKATSHIVAALHNVSLLDTTSGCGRYPHVLQVSDIREDEDFLSADLLLVNAEKSISIEETTIACSIKAPVITLRFRYVQEVLEYLKHGSLQRLLASPAPQAETAVTAPSASIHSSVLQLVSSLFQALVASNILNKSATSTSLVLPKVHVDMQNLVVLIPSTSASEELVRFELGKVDASNKGGVASASELSVSIDGMQAVSVYHNAESQLVSQSLLRRVGVTCDVELSSLLSARVGVTPVHFTLNQEQLDFITHRLLQNFAEAAVTVYESVAQPASEAVMVPEASEGSVAQPASEAVADTVSSNEHGSEVPSLPEPAPISASSEECPEIRVDVRLDAVRLEVMKNGGGYSEAEQNEACGSNKDSLTVLELNNLTLGCELNRSELAVGVELASLSLIDARQDAKISELLKRPVLLGDDHEPALSVLCLLNEETHVRVAMHRARVFVAPLFVELVALASSLNSILVEDVPSDAEAAAEGSASNEEAVDAKRAPITTEDTKPALNTTEDTKPAPITTEDTKPALNTTEDTKPAPSTTGEKGISLSPFLANLLPHLFVTVSATPLTLYFPSSFARASPLLLVSVSPTVSVSFTSTLDTSVSLSLADFRIAQCTEECLTPSRDYLDVMQSWCLCCDLQCKDAFRTINTSIQSMSSVQLSVGYRDISIVLHCLEDFTQLLKGVSKPAQEQPSATTSLPVIALPLIVSRGPLNLSVSVHLPSVQLEVINDIGVAELPFVQCVLSELTLSASLDAQLFVLLQFELAADFYNHALIAWEPLIEPWPLLAQVTQRQLTDDASSGEMPCQSSCTLQAEKMMNVNVSHAFCASTLQLLHDFDEVRSHSVHTESGYYVYVNNQLSDDIEFEVVFDGGFGNEVKKLQKEWERIEARERTLLKSGLLFMQDATDTHLVSVELYSVEPFVRVTSGVKELVSDKNSFRWREENEKALFDCSFTQNETRTVSFFANENTEKKEWSRLRSVTLATPPAASDALSVPAHSSRRSSLPAHPSLPLLRNVESYNQRIVSVSIPNCARIEFCCDTEAELPFSVHSLSGEFLYDVLVHITNQNGVRSITLSSLFSVVNHLNIPVLCRFVEDTEVQGCQVEVKQSQKKQKNLEDDTDNFFGAPIGSNNAAFDTKTPSVGVRRYRSTAESFVEMKKDETVFDSAQRRMKGRFEIMGSHPGCLVSSFSESDITSLNLRRTCVNIGSPDRPQYCLLRVRHHIVKSDHLVAIPHEMEKKKSADVLGQIENETVDDVFGAYGSQRSVFEVECSPMLLLKNLLPIDVEFRILKREGGVIPVESGTLRPGEEKEVASVNGEQKERFFVAIRPLNQQFVWNNEVIPIQPNCSGYYKLSDLENSGTVLGYEYSFSASSALVLSVFCQYWVMNRCGDELLITDGKKKTTQFLAGNQIALEGEKEEKLQPAIFGVEREKKTVIALRKKTSNWSTVTTLVKDQPVQVILPPSPPFDMNQTYYSVTVKQLSEPFAKTRLITIYPLFVFRNQSELDVTLSDGYSSFALESNSMKELNSFSASSSGVTFTLTKEGRELHSPLLRVSETGQYDFVMKEEYGESNPSFFRMDSAIEANQRVITFSSIEPQSVAYCLSNRSCLSSLRVAQMGCDLAWSVVVPPLSSRMFVLPNPCGTKQVVLFVENVLAESEQRYAPCMIVDLEASGEKGVIRRKDMAEALRVGVENENATFILVVRPEEKEEKWLLKKQYEHKQILLEEALNRARFEYASVTKEITTFTEALSEFEQHALTTSQASLSSGVQPAVIVGKGASDEIDLMLNDHYFWIKSQLVSISNPRRKPCAIQLRVTNQETMIETEAKKGSHVTFDKEMVFEHASTSLFVMVTVQFERARLELRSEIHLEDFAEFNQLRFIRVPLTLAGQDEEARALCGGGSFFCYIVHCKNNRVTNAQKGYLPSLLCKQFCDDSQLQLLTTARAAVAYETLHVGAQRVSEAMGLNVHLQQALKNETGEATEEHEKEENEEFEQTRRFAVELDEVDNIMTSKSRLFASIRVDGKRLDFGEAKKLSTPAAYSATPVTFVIRSMKPGCSFSLQQDGRYIVTKVVKDSEADRSGVCVGMVLWSVNDALVSGEAGNMKDRLKMMKRPVKLSLLPPFRQVNVGYVNAVWKSRVLLPSGVTLNKPTVSLVISDEEDSVVFEKEVKVRRFNEYNGYEGKPDALTGCHLKTEWVSDERSVVVDTQVSVALNGVAVSLLNAKPVEVLTAYLKDLSLTLTCDSSRKQSVSLTLNTLQIDNQLLNALSPVLLGAVNPKKPAIAASAVLLPHASVPCIHSCELTLNPLFLAMDNRLLVALIQFIGDIPFHLLAGAKNAQYFDIPEFSPNSSIVLRSASSTKLFIEHLAISDVCLTVSNKIDPATTVTGVFLPPTSFFVPVQTVLDTLCGLVANIDDTEIVLQAYTLHRFFGYQTELVRAVTKFFVPQVTKQVLKVLGSVNLLGNPVGLINDVRSGIKAFVVDPTTEEEYSEGFDKRVQEGGKVLIQNTTKGVLNTVAKVTGTLSDGVAALSFNKHYKEQRILGRKGFIHGLTSGVTGVVMDPVRGAKKGVKGLLEGVGTGLVGVVTKPVSGLLDDAAKLMETAKDSISHQEKVARVRLPRCILCDHVLRGFDEKMAFGQELYFTATTRYRVESEPDEQYVFHCCVDKNTHYFVLTQYHCMLLSPNADLLWYLPVAGLQIDVDDEEMRILTNNESKLVLFSDKDICSRLYGILLNLPSWSVKEIVQCCSGFYGFVRQRGKSSEDEL